PSLLPLSILPHPPSPLPPPHSFPTRRSSDLSGEYKQYDCCLGSRFMRGSRIKGYSALRIFGNYGFNWLFSLVTLHKITDLGSGLNLYRVASLKNRYYLKFPDTLYFNDCMILAQCQIGRASCRERVTTTEDG